MNIKKKLNKISKLRSDINKYFDNSSYELIVDNTDVYWSLDGHTVGWSEESLKEKKECLGPYDYIEHTYSADVRGSVRKKDYTLVTIRTSTGDGCEDHIFDNSKEVNLDEV